MKKTFVVKLCFKSAETAAEYLAYFRLAPGACAAANAEADTEIVEEWDQ